MQWILDIGLIGLLIAMLVRATVLSRALAELKRDRGPLEALVTGFAASTREAQHGIEQLRLTADGAGRRLAQQSEAAGVLRDDLAYVMDRAERLADRLDQLVRAARPLEPRKPEPTFRIPPVQPGFTAARPREALLHDAASHDRAEPPPAAHLSKMRSQAERDLMQALRMHK